MTSARDVIADWCVEHGDGSWPPDESATILITALESAGWVIVPVEPTREMLAAVDGEADDKYLARGRAYSAYRAMLASRPQEPS